MNEEYQRLLNEIDKLKQQVNLSQSRNSTPLSEMLLQDRAAIILDKPAHLISESEQQIAWAAIREWFTGWQGK